MPEPRGGRFLVGSATIALLVTPPLRGAAIEPRADPPAVAAVAAAPELVEARAALAERVRRGEAPSFAVGVVREGGILWAEAIGWADRERERAAAPDTLYPVASVSKSITATGALALIAKKRLALDQPVLPLLEPGALAGEGGAAEEVRLTHLLAHTSGIPHLWHYEYPDRPETLVGPFGLPGVGFVASKPGARFAYSNLGYGVLGVALARASGTTLQRAMTEALLQPLGMQRTTVEAWVGRGEAATGYDGEGRAIPHPYRLAPAGGAGFFSTLDDLLRYVRFHLGGEGPDEAPGASVAIARALAEHPVAGHYLFGWGVVETAAGPALISDGEIAGGAAMILLLPARRLGALALANSTGAPVGEVAVGILEALAPGFAASFGVAVERIEREIEAPGTPPSGRFAGELRDGDERIAIELDFTDPRAPRLELGGWQYPLQRVGWQRGALEATVVGSLPVGAGKSRTHRLRLALWRDSDELRGVATEQISDDRPGSGLPHYLVLRPVS